jgi:hypothetical protein
MVTLISFLLFTMAFVALVHIESPFPVASTQGLNETLKEKPLQLTLSINEKEAQIWSPFDRIPTKKIPNNEPGQPNFKAIHEALIGIKQQFPAETKAVLVPYAGATYELLVSAMDALRTLEPSDPPVYRRNQETGNDEVVKTLFPEVIFGNLLGD